jgi:hypothetical protein
MAIIKSEGVTHAERYLKRLCEHSFLSLWSYPGVFRDQGGGNLAGGQGKEVCDLLVVFDHHILIFSDKDCKFPNSGDIKRDWTRWFRRAIVKSARQVCGAERWIKEHPERLFLDRACKQRFPIPIPDIQAVKFHRLVVAHESAQRCHEHYGGSGSFLLNSAIEGDQHLLHPFTIGHLDRKRGYVHVLDDVALEIVMKTLDTITDFVIYLERKEELMCRSDFGVFPSGEEELLAYYLGGASDTRGGHYFIPPPKGSTALILAEGLWEQFVNSPERHAQLRENEISYFWDQLIENFSKYILAGTPYWSHMPGIQPQEQVMRWMARECRTRRRLLSKAFLEFLNATSDDRRSNRFVIGQTDEPMYTFLAYPRLPGLSDEKYREERMEYLILLCTLLTQRFPQVEHVVGIAVETKGVERRSEDAIYLKASDIPAEVIDQAKNRQFELDLLTGLRFSAFAEHEFPVAENASHRIRFKVGRNDPCPCGSGKKYKHCCGRRV